MSAFTTRPEPKRRVKPLQSIGYAAELVRDGASLVLRCERKAWVKTFDAEGVILSTSVEPKSLWFTANIATRLLVMPRDVRINTIGAYNVVGVAEDYRTLRVVHASSDEVACGMVCVLKLKGWAT